MKNDLPLGVDFAALHTLKLVYDLRSFTAAAARLQVNQSAVSYTIDKLRAAFGDPLFFRQGGQVVPTDRCVHVAQEAARLLESFSDLVEPQEFDPNTAEGSVTVACNYYEMHVILPAVIKTLRKQAKGLRLTLLNATHQGPGLLKSGEADLVIGPIKPDESGFFCRRVLDDHYVCVMDAQNPLAADSLTAKRYGKGQHITVNYGGEWRSQYQIDLSKRGIHLNETLDVPSPSSLALVIPGTDLISTIPSRIAAAMANELHVMPSPYPAPFEIFMVWTTRTHQSAMHSWLRGLVSDTIKTHLSEAK